MSSGDRDAFAQFYDRHAAALFGLALKIMNDPKEAEDVLQDALLQLWEKASSFDETLGKPLGWAFTLVRNRAIDRIRSLQRHRRVFDAAVDEDAAPLERGDVASAADAAVESEEAHRVRGCLGVLPSDQRQAIEMAFFGGLSQSEIAETLALPLGTIKARIRRGMIRMREVLEANPPQFSSMAKAVNL